MKPIQHAQQLLNQFRQLHVLKSDLASFNQKLMSSPLEVIDSIPTLLGGNLLSRHHQMLSDKTLKMDQIARENLPFPELATFAGIVDIAVSDMARPAPVNASSFEESMTKALNTFTPDTAHLNTFKRDFGPNWRQRLAEFVKKSSLTEIQKKAHVQVLDFADAIDSWHLAETILDEKNQVKARANLAALEKALSKFGQPGLDLFERLKTLANQ
ncbi:MAG: hypothetical protein JW812_00680 [Alphaproteobacteria bacterium]|nr:hypothetical protein [Alphaproteobacteria bacterium]MBN2779768.1 hypothetical protein [Alphaproteobacteria bacterium]